MTVTEVRRESVGEEKEALKVLDFKSIFFVLHLFLYNMVRLRTGCISVRRHLTSSSKTNLMTLLRKQLLKLSMKRYDGDGDDGDGDGDGEEVHRIFVISAVVLSFRPFAS